MVERIAHSGSDAEVLSDPAGELKVTVVLALRDPDVADRFEGLVVHGLGCPFLS